MITQPQRGLPPRVYLPIVLVFAAVFLTIVSLLVKKSLDTGGSVFGTGTGAGARQAAVAAAPPAVNVEGGGPPVAVRAQLQELQTRVQRNPKDDVALTQLGDMYLAAGKDARAIPFYKRALAANPNNVAAKEGLSQAQSALSGGQ